MCASFQDTGPALRLTFLRWMVLHGGGDGAHLWTKVSAIQSETLMSNRPPDLFQRIARYKFRWTYVAPCFRGALQNLIKMQWYLANRHDARYELEWYKIPQKHVHTIFEHPSQYHE
jgi:hypothetical protein